MEIKFDKVGREKYSGSISFDANCDLDADDIAALAYKEARKHLVSVSVETYYDESKNQGDVFAGFCCVGHFKVVK